MNRTGQLGACLATLALLGCVGCGGQSETPQAERDDFQPDTIEELECMPDLDGRIEADQLQPAFDIPVNYRISPAGHERPVDLAGFQDQLGNRVWDFTTEEYELADENLEVLATELDGKWYDDEFEGGEFTTVLDASLDLDAVYSHGDEHLYLHGYASATEEPDIGQTLVVYDEPVVAYEFPLQEGDAWQSTGEVQDGRVRGLPYTAQEHYEFEVDASGALWLPDITFDQVLRVRTKLTIDSAIGHPIYREQIQFLFECFGEVTRLVGPDVELDDDTDPGDYEFDRTVEMRRLGF